MPFFHFFLLATALLSRVVETVFILDLFLTQRLVVLAKGYKRILCLASGRPWHSNSESQVPRLPALLSDLVTHSSLSAVVNGHSLHSQLAQGSIPRTHVPTGIEAQLQQVSTHNPHKKHPEQLAQVTSKTTPLGSTEHLLHKATLPRLGDITDPTNMYEPTQGAARIRGQKNMYQTKEQEKPLEKELNKMEASNLSDTEF